VSSRSCSIALFYEILLFQPFISIFSQNIGIPDQQTHWKYTQKTENHFWMYEGGKPTQQCAENAETSNDQESIGTETTDTIALIITYHMYGGLCILCAVVLVSLPIGVWGPVCLFESRLDCGEWHRVQYLMFHTGIIIMESSYKFTSDSEYIN